MTAISFNEDWAYRLPHGPFRFVHADEPPNRVRLPHDALRDAQRRADAPGGGAGAYFPPGAYTYLKEFDVPEQWRGKAVRLEVQGAFRRAQVFLNDEFAGNRADGYARFLVDLTPYLAFGARNTLRIEVRSGEDSRWYSGSGLHRPVILHVHEPVHVPVDGQVVRTLRIEDGEAAIEVVTSVVNLGLVTSTVRLHTQISAAAASLPCERQETPITLVPGETGTVRQRFWIRDAELWSPDDPHLYVAETALTDSSEVPGGDTEAVTRTIFGVRTVTVDPRSGLRINGRPTLLRGACIHHDNGPLGAAAIGRAEERRVELLKAAGFNAIRASHNPLSVAMLDACDRLGMLVIDEAFDMWTRFKTPYDYAAEFPQWWADDLGAMVDKDRNHPSVIMYSIGNEIAEVGTPHGARWARHLAETVRALDPTRPVTNGVNGMLAVLDEIPAVIESLGGLNAAMASGNMFSAVSSSRATTERIEESSAALDVLGLNYGESRYARDAQAFPHRVIVGSETFASRIGELWPLVRENPNVIGDFTWTGWDYLGEVGIGSTTYAGDTSASGRLEREFPYLTAWCGDLDITGWRRPVSFYREIVFGLRSEPYIAVRRPAYHGRDVVNPSPWAWSDSISSWTWSDHANAPVTVEVYADADEIVLELDGVEIGRGIVGETKPMMAVIETVYRPGTLVAIAYAAGGEVGRTSLSTAGTGRLTATADRSQIVDDDADLAYVAIELRDAQGRLVADADRRVEVFVEGPAVLAGMCSADPSTSERFDSNTWRTFDGRALAVLRPTSTGRASVTITAGHEVVTLAIEVVAGREDRLL